jgi:xanthine dehydrogenase YagS FAD-binding subunit
MAGGADLLNLVKSEILRPAHIVSLKGAAQSLKYLTQTPSNGVRIGALTTMYEIENHAMVRERYTALAEAAAVVASPQIRKVGTIGGNICQRPWCWYFRRGFPCLKNGGGACYSVAGENQYNAILGGGPSYIVHPSDTAPALVALGAQVAITGPTGIRVMDLERFFVLPRVTVARENVLRPGEIVTELRLPSPAPGTRSTYLKVSERASWDHAIVSVAAAVTKRDGKCQAARVVLGGVAPIPWRVVAVEQLITGKAIDERLAREAGEAALAGAEPLSRNAYKIDLAKQLVARALLALA